MFLKRVLIKNFKSFSGKNVLDFPALITAIVGPNGSGKSNVVDAIRWALGEQSFKNLRAEKGEDLIFRGGKKGLISGFAEVELIFDNSQKIFPFDVSELSILRRIDRNENNSYFLNRQPCRLKDIIEISAAAKLGLKGFSIVNQGSADAILRVSPQERRMMLEENLGLKSLEIKKEEAKRKLNSTAVNLDKARSLHQEILPRLRSLKRQVARWEKREEIKNELSLLGKKYFTIWYRQIIKENPSQNFDIKKIEQRISELSLAIKNKEIELGLLKEKKDESLESRITCLTNQIIDLQNKKSLIWRELGRKEAIGQSVFSEKEIESKIKLLKKSLEELLEISDPSLLKKRIKEIIGDLDAFYRIESKETGEEVKKIKGELEEIEHEINEKNKLLKEQQKLLNERGVDFKNKFQEIEVLREEKDLLLRQVQKEEILNEKRSLRLEDFKRRLRETNFSFEEIEENYRLGKEEELDSLIEELPSLERKISNLRRALADIGIEDENIIAEYRDVSSRYEFLNQQVEDLEKSFLDLKKLIVQLNNQIKEKFDEAVREINEEFNRYFGLIFKGGEAKLIQIEKAKNVNKNQEEEIVSDGSDELKTLNNQDDDSLGWGIDIKVKIPKTKLRSLEMLSGGERTLVAICLILAIINQSDPPLLIVDEIDAALDEENSRFFAEILKELSKNTQFIIVTHNRMTMTAASVIYGVTLSENNSSQLISLKLEEAEEVVKD